MYALGIDLGTTFTAAATWRDGHAEIASLGSRAAVIPSVVLLREDETVLTGETAHRRGLSEPHRVSREFKRRLGDTTPILLGGAPYSAEALMGRLLRSVVDDVAQREGGQPSSICISHPANWGPYKKDLLSQAVRLSNLDQAVTYATEPEAAAVFYAQQQRVEPGAVVAVYDLGGGTFDAAVLRKTGSGFEILGQPEGIERLGGIDFDAAVFSHVRQALGGKLDELDEDDPSAVAAVARLREECVAAKEVLSSDTDASIPVLLPNVATEIRLTRAELESMVRPALHSTIEALRRALRSAGVAPEQLHSVLLVGGSSRMPLVGQMVGAELGRPVAVDAHPKHAIALGAAWLASGNALTGPATAGAKGTAGAAGLAGPAAAAGAAAAGAAAGAAAAAHGSHPDTQPAQPVAGAAAGTPAAAAGQAAPVSPPAAPGAPVSPPAGTRPPFTGTATVPAGTTGPGTGGPMPSRPPIPAFATGTAQTGYPQTGYAQTGGPPPPPPAPPAPPPDRARRRLLLVVGATLAVVVLAGGAVAYAFGGEDDPDAGPGGKETPSTEPSTAESPQTSEAPTAPVDEQCTEEIQSNERWVCITSATVNGQGQLVIEYDAEFAGTQPDVNGGYHLHVYGGDGTNPPDDTMGKQSDNQGNWVIRDTNPAVLSTDEIANVIGDNPKVCARIADGGHYLVPSTDGEFTTGNCWPIER